MRMIDADALMKKICGNECDSVCDEECENALCNFYDYIMDAPTIKPEVRHGRWKKKNGEIYCTNCKKSKWSESFDLMLRRFNYCPNCGAKMDEGAK